MTKEGFASELRRIGAIQFPEYTGLRIMMMPVHLHDSESLPNFVANYRPMFAAMVEAAPCKRGTGYLTIDEAHVRAGETHRRPGLHIDGTGGWGGNPGPWGGPTGMMVAASVTGCRAWPQWFDGEPGHDGNCDHLAEQLGLSTYLEGGHLFWLGSHAVHESIPCERDCRRQFVRLSMPSSAPWYDGYTTNPLGIQPTGPVMPRRVEQMSYRK